MSAVRIRRRTSLGDAFSDQLTEYGGLTSFQQGSIEGGGNVDPYAFAVATGILPDSDAGRALYDQWNGTYGGGGFLPNFAASIVAQPALTALLVAWQAINANKNNNGFNVDMATAFANVTNPPGGTPTYSSGLELPASLSPAQAGPYLAWLRQLWPQLLAEFQFNQSPLVQDAQRTASEVGAARAAALAEGALTTPYGPIALSLIDEGPVTLPDGWVYVVAHDVPGGDGDYVQWWAGPNGNGNLPLNRAVSPEECDIAPGSGMWYGIGAIGGTCPPPPIGWVYDGWTKISARAKASLMLNSENVAPAPTTVTVPVVTSAPPVIVQDQDGNVITAATLPYEGSTPVLISTLPGTAPVSSGAPNTKELLIIGAIAALGLLALRGSK